MGKWVNGEKVKTENFLFLHFAISPLFRYLVAGSYFLDLSSFFRIRQRLKDLFLFE